jgi:hypothetical protein
MIGLEIIFVFDGRAENLDALDDLPVEFIIEPKLPNFVQGRFIVV